MEGKGVRMMERECDDDGDRMDGNDGNERFRMR